MSNFTYQERSKFAEAIMPLDLIDDAISWISKHCNPGDVFTNEILNEYIKTEYQPDDVFNHEQLEEWAELNGFVKATN